MNRKDFRPTTSNINSLSEKDRKMIIENRNSSSLPNESRKDFLARIDKEERISDYQKALDNIKNPPKKDWYMSQKEYDRERAMDKEVAKYKGKRKYIETRGKDTK